MNNPDRGNKKAIFYENGEHQLQEEELSSGTFYAKDNLSELPRKLSLARKMID